MCVKGGHAEQACTESAPWLLPGPTQLDVCDSQGSLTITVGRHDGVSPLSVSESGGYREVERLIRDHTAQGWENHLIGKVFLRQAQKPELDSQNPWGNNKQNRHVTFINLALGRQRQVDLWG